MSEQVTECVVIAPRCPICGAGAGVWIHVDALTELPMFSGWECLECQFFELDHAA